MENIFALLTRLRTENASYTETLTIPHSKGTDPVVCFRLVSMFYRGLEAEIVFRVKQLYRLEDRDVPWPDRGSGH
ncbi:hypothetical protein [Taibaiella koreensis]|uniref:hypothetical protein n=1 Tax=Taibaiella koreensis TaxID=1268548 RepID=UPI000E59A7A1|nr:hypothetical protein [Taibaiella koreensis]